MKKFSSLLLAFVLTVTLLPIAAFADTDPDLTATNLTLIETGTAGEYRVTVDYANSGGTDVDPSVGGSNKGTVNATEQTSSYGWSSLADVSFLTAGGEKLGAMAFPHSITLTDGDIVEVCIDAGDDVIESDETNNCVSETFDVITGPDLTVTDVRLDSRNQVVYEVANQGDEDVDASLSGVQTISVDGVVEKSYSWSSLGDTDFLTAGESSTLYTDALAEGIYTVEVCIDTTDVVTESDETNNCFSTEVTAVAVGDDDDDDDDDDSTTTGADLVVTDIFLNSFNVVEYTVENQGDTDIDTSLNGRHTIAVDGDIVSNYWWARLADLDFLAAGGSTDLGTPVDLDSGFQTVEVCVDVEDVATESDESNNCLSEDFTVESTGDDDDDDDSTGTTMTVEAGSDQSLTLGDTLILDTEAYLENLSGGDTPTATIDWGDGNSEDASLEISNRIYIEGSHTYAAVGTYTVTVCGTDSEDGVELGTVCDTFTVTVNAVDTGDDDDDDDDSSGGSSGGSNSRPSHDNPDLSVNDIYIQADGDVVANLSNEGDEDVSSSDSVRVQVTIDGELEWTEDYEQDEDDDFLDEDEESDINVGELLSDEDETYEIEVCVDTRDQVEELRETNNCRTENLSIDDDAGDEDDDSSDNGPDLSVDDIYIQADGDIVATLSNEGDEDVDDNDDVRVVLSIDGDTEWTQDYEQSSSDNFLDEGEESDINMGDLLDEEDETYEIEVCVDTSDEVNEDDEGDNCRTENLSIEDDAGDTVTLSSESSDDDDCDEYFYDINGDASENEICNLYDREVVIGRKPHYYIPHDSVTRAEFLKIALLNSGLDVEGVRSGDDFTDVNSNDWFYDYVTFARDLGIVGADDGKFYPNEDITRAEAMAILVRLELDGNDLDDLLDEDLDDSDIDFNDVDDDDWFAAYIVYGEEEALIQGYSNGNFRPGNPITRSEAAEIAYNLYRNRY